MEERHQSPRCWLEHPLPVPLAAGSNSRQRRPTGAGRCPLSDTRPPLTLPVDAISVTSDVEGWHVTGSPEPRDRIGIFIPAQADASTEPRQFLTGTWEMR